VNEATGNRPIIGVLTWNGYAKARACIASLLSLREWPIPVVVVDNGSVDAEGQRLATEFGPPVSSIRLPTNINVAGGYNAAIRWAAEHNATHVLLLNNDTLVADPDLLGRLVAAAEPDVAGVGPIVLSADGTPFSAGGRIEWATGWSGHARDPVRTDRPYAAEWLDGPCVLVSLEAVRQIGGLDPVFESYWEDVDWCVRARRAGYRCLVEPRVSIVHLRGGSITSPEANAYNLRNGLLFIRRNGTRLNNLTTLANYVFHRAPALILGRTRLRGRSQVTVKAVVSALTWNVRDAFRAGGWRVIAGGPSIQDMPQPIE
jgi:GT2 family glycosyltransferase